MIFFVYLICTFLFVASIFGIIVFIINLIVSYNDPSAGFKKFLYTLFKYNFYGKKVYSENTKILVSIIEDQLKNNSYVVENNCIYFCDKAVKIEFFDDKRIYEIRIKNKLPNWGDNYNMRSLLYSMLRKYMPDYRKHVDNDISALEQKYFNKEKN